MVDRQCPTAQRAGRQVGLERRVRPRRWRGSLPLVKSAIGFDAKRGDQIYMVSMRFISEGSAVRHRAAALLFGIGLDNAVIVRLAETGLIGVIGLLALLLVLRPMVLRLTTLGPHRLGGGGGDLAVALPRPSSAGMVFRRKQRWAHLASAPTLACCRTKAWSASPRSRGQLRASSIRRVSDLADKHPDEIPSILRGWMAQESS